MTETQKANVYGQLLNQHTRLYNQINEIKSQNQDMDFKQRRQVMELEAQQHQIMRQIKKLFS
jgi:hypothetical protein